ncbi:MAG: hypothetical protein WCY43_00885 [Patescibacteria group bacterium]|nr:hypothetical protein [Patescibacteria group bacterium]
MSKLYKIVFIIIISLLAVLNVIFLIYNKKIASYFKFSVDVEKPELIMKEIEKEASDSFFDLSRLSNPKFLNLKEFQVDLTGFNLPGDLAEGDSIFDEGEEPLGEDPLIPSDPEIEIPAFEVGNDNPFSPIKK